MENIKKVSIGENEAQKTRTRKMKIKGVPQDDKTNLHFIEYSCFKKP